MRNRTQQRGFTLIEVTVALALLALSLGVLYESFGWSLRRSDSIRKREISWLAAQSILADVRARPILQTGETQGTTDHGSSWTLKIARHDPSIKKLASLEAFDVTVDVRWGNRPAQHVRLQSVEIGRPAL